MKFFKLEKTNYFTKWAGATLKALAWALIAVMAFMMIMGYKFMIVSSGSMEPTLPVGSIVIVTPCEYDDLEFGDIVTMDAGGINLTHRIVGKTKDISSVVLLTPDDPGYDEATWWVTKGDNSDTLDGALTKDIVGKVYEGHCFVWVGLIVRYVRANYKMVIAMGVIIVAFVFILEWLKDKMVEDDVECYDNDEEE